MRSPENVLESLKSKACNENYKYQRLYRQQVQQARAADPEYLQRLDEKERLKQEKLLEKERKRSERSAQRAKLTRAELKEKAKTDPEAAAKWAALKAREAEARQRKRSVKKPEWRLTQNMPP